MNQKANLRPGLWQTKVLENTFLSFQRVLDHETYIFNLETANALGQEIRPSYFKYYSARKDLEMDSLFPQDYDLLAKRMATDDQFYAKYFR